MKPWWCLAVMAIVAGCGGRDDGGSFVEVLCATVQAWSDGSVDVVNAFSRDSPGLDPTARRGRYAGALADLSMRLDVLADRVGHIDAPGDVAAELSGAIEAMRSNLEEVRADAVALADSAYEFASVRDGRLFTGLEKNQAIVYQALSDLADEGAVPRGCGRRGPLDLSPAATYPD